MLMTGEYIHDRFETVVLHPQWSQFCIAQLPAMAACAVMIIGWRMDWFHIGEAFLLIGLFIVTFLLCQAAYIARVEYIITDEQIIYLHGIMHRETDFMELYRVVDYQEKRTFMQQMAGLKNVVIYSMDRNTPVLTILGMKGKLELIGCIRERVEANKKRKGIYEITNRM